mmetsp:Transcript_29878/g.68549  ORF Transcript_29878/g.68549 Transcript_29878/m.68549 type:complete len:124 (-) Transcript_29878:218-589(-)
MNLRRSAGSPEMEAVHGMPTMGSERGEASPTNASRSSLRKGSLTGRKLRRVDGQFFKYGRVRHRGRTVFSVFSKDELPRERDRSTLDKNNIIFKADAVMIVYRRTSICCLLKSLQDKNFIQIL